MDRILVVHNRYLQRGGEDTVVEAEVDMLRSAGLEVETYDTSTTELRTDRLFGRVRAAIAATWSREHFRGFRTALRRFEPTLVHCHNLFPIPSPAIYYAAAAERIPVVQTLHNFRALCLNALFLRDGNPCHECLGRAPWRGIVHRCYRDSTAGSLSVASHIVTHRAAGTWRRRVARYIALSNTASRVFMDGGLPSDRIRVKPNFVWPDPGAGDHEDAAALFVGRLSEEKGVDVLLDAWRQMPSEISLRIVGDGPYSPEVMKAARSSTAIQYLGALNREQVLQEMARARVLVFPSKFAEGWLPLVPMEAMATGLPILSSDVPGLAELIESHRGGWVFRSGSGDSLKSTLQGIWRDRSSLTRAGRLNRDRYQSEFSRERNLNLLLGIYDEACGEVGVPAA